MNDGNLLIYWLTQCLMQLPVLIVCFSACVVVLLRWKQAPSRSWWAVSGFGLACLLSIVLPTAQMSTQRWLIENHDSMAQVGLVMTKLSFFWSFLHAVTYALLLAAVCASRATPPPASPPPLPAQANPPSA